MRKISKTDNRQSILLLWVIKIDDRMASVNPRKSAPQSPINMDDFGKFLGKNPMMAPSNRIRQTAMSEFSNIIAKDKRQSASLAQIPPASPSSPSIMLVAFVINIIQIATITPQSDEKSLLKYSAVK